MIRKGTLLEGKYEILEEIGKGGGGIVYLAYHHGLQIYVIVKEIKEAHINQINTRLEVDILKNLQHISLPQVYDFVSVEGQIYTVMQYINGYDLEFYRKSGYQLSEKQLVVWLRQLLEVLDYLHTRPTPIIHSDVKPGNVMIDSSGIACLIDFNISINTSEVVIKGASLEYAAPEQLTALYERMGGNYVSTVLNEKTDLYSLGLTFYAMMTGIVPAREREMLFPITSITSEYSEAFVGVINKLMNTNPSRRYGTAKKAIHALDLMVKKPSAKLSKWNICLTVGYSLALMISLGSVVIGIYDSWNEEYGTNYKVMQDAYYACEAEDVRNIGNTILEEKKYQYSLNSNSNQEAEIYYMLGETYFWEENYAIALNYYEDAIDVAGEEDNLSVYYRDAAICMAKLNYYEDASLLLNEAKRNGVSSEDLLLAEAEIMLYQDDIDGAKETFELLIEENEDSEVVYRSCIELANIYKSEENWEMVVKYLEKAYEVDGNILILRKLGIAYSDCCIYSEKSEDKSIWGDKAKSVYEELIQSNQRTYEDYLNYAIICEINKEYLQCSEILKQMEQEYPDDYVVSKKLCYILYYIENEKAVDQRDYTNVIYYYEKAIKEYEIIKNSGEEDVEMIQLEQIMSTLLR